NNITPTPSRPHQGGGKEQAARPTFLAPFRGGGGRSKDGQMRLPCPSPPSTRLTIAMRRWITWSNPPPNSPASQRRTLTRDLHFPALPRYIVPVLFFLMVKTLAGPRSRSYRLQITCICR